MPELPEVETVKNGLSPHIKGATITDVVLRRANLRIDIPQNLADLCRNQKVISLKRRGKYLLINLSNDYTIVIHLGMSGTFIISNGSEDYAKHDHVIFKYCNNGGKEGEIRYNDPRRFGLIDIMRSNVINDYKYIKNLGTEPLTDEFNGTWLHNKLKNKSVTIKLAIMDANLVVGVGNIYANEALFKAKIHPKTPAKTVSKKRCEALCAIIKTTLNEAIAAGGSSLKDHRQADGKLGYFQHQFKVYGKDKELCDVCSHNIEKIVIGGRATYYCPKCQHK